MTVSPDRSHNTHLHCQWGLSVTVSPQRGHKATQQSISFLQLFLFPITQHFHPEWDEKRDSCFMWFAFFPIYYLWTAQQSLLPSELRIQNPKAPLSLSEQFYLLQTKAISVETEISALSLRDFLEI